MESIAVRGGTGLRARLASLDSPHIATLILGVLSLASYFVFIRTDFVLDLPLMHFVAWRVSEGDAPYVDVWDMNGPAAYMIHQLMRLVPLPEKVVTSLAMTGLTAACVVSIATVAGRGNRRWLGFAAGLAMLAAIAGRGGDFLAQRDMFIATFAAVSLALVTRESAMLWRWGVAGVLIGLAVGVKPTAAPFALIAAAGAFWIDMGEGRAYKRTLWLGVGGALGGAVWVVWLLATGGLVGWWSMMIDHNAAYAKIAREPLLVLLKEPAVWLAAVGGAASVMAALSRRKAGAGREIVAGLMMTGLFALVASALYLAQGKGWPYQASPAAVLGMLSIGMAVWGFGHVFTPKPVMVTAAVAAVCLFSLGGLRQQFEPWHAKIQADRTDIANQMTAALIALPPGMKVQPLDTTDGALHAMTDAKRAQASPVMYDFFLFEGDADDIAEARAEVLAVAERGDAAFLITNGGWPDFRTGFARIREFKELQAILDTHYTLVSAGQRGPYDFRLFAPAE